MDAIPPPSSFPLQTRTFQTPRNVSYKKNGSCIATTIQTLPTRIKHQNQYKRGEETIIRSSRAQMRPGDPPFQTGPQGPPAPLPPPPAPAPPPPASYWPPSGPAAPLLGPPAAPAAPPPPPPPGGDFCDCITQCLSFLCCCWLVELCFGGPPPPGPPGPLGPPPPGPPGPP